MSNPGRIFLTEVSNECRISVDRLTRGGSGFSLTAALPDDVMPTMTDGPSLDDGLGVLTSLIHFLNWHKPDRTMTLNQLLVILD